jgi:menaquinol-cytochrome c reductase iron-sulfur subunit
VPTERKGKPKTTADALIPGAFEGETVTRRRLMVGGTHLFGAAAAAAIALPALGFALGPVFERQKARWENVGPLNELPLDTYVPKVFTMVNDIGEAGKTTVYLRRYNPEIDTEPADEYNRAIAISTRCAHLGCPVRYIQASESFVCPCHGGVYDREGKRTGGPPVRPLDRFYTRITSSGDVEVGPRYSVNSELRRFSPRDPGEPLDGIGQYVYPARFSTAKP